MELYNLLPIATAYKFMQLKNVISKLLLLLFDIASDPSVIMDYFLHVQ